MHSQKLLAHALESAANAILITDRKGVILWLNQAMCLVSGYTREELIGHTPRLFHSGLQDAAFYSSMWRTILAGQPWQGILVDRRKDGALYTVSQVITPLFGANGDVTHFLSIQHDISESEHENARTRWLAYHDVLTGLPNRALFLELLTHALAEAANSSGWLAVLFIDLDNFKRINDVYGHSLGDRFLMAVAERLGGAVRQSDLVARLGGDEFTILLKGDSGSGAEVASALADKLVHTLGQPYRIDDQALVSGASIGIALYPEHGGSADSLLDCADQAMYQAKAAGRGCYCLFRAPGQATV